MNNPIENLISLIAPHRCILCRSEGEVLCKNCASISLIRPPSRCYRCHKATKQSQVCENCRRPSGLKHVWVASEYDETAKNLIYKLKFERARAAAKNIANVMSENLPDLPATTVVTHIPTANSRIRMRGYDQAKLIAQALAKNRGWRYEDLLDRSGSSRQVGASRDKRLKQLTNAFRVKNQGRENDHVLLVDDVLTTGATIEASANALKSAGVKTLDAVVFTQPID